MNRVHPLISFMYFCVMVGLTLVLEHPMCRGISLVAAIILAFKLNDRYKLVKRILMILPIVVSTAIINPLFSHEGMTIIGYMYDGNPITVESIYYGISAATLLLTILIWFISINNVMTSDKIIYLFGNIIPNLSVILSMTLRFVPRFTKRISDTYKVRERLYCNKNNTKCNNTKCNNTKWINKIRNAIQTLSITITWALEDSIDTADSMKNRAYGCHKRTAYSNYIFSKSDVRRILYLVIGTLILLVIVNKNIFYWHFYPIVGGGTVDYWFEMGIGIYVVFFIYPVIWWSK